MSGSSSSLPVFNQEFQVYNKTPAKPSAWLKANKLDDWLAGLDEGWTESEVDRILLSGLPRRVMALTEEEKLKLFRSEPRLKGGHWDALVAGLVEHLCDLHQLPLPEWVNKPERFLDSTWVPADYGMLSRVRSLYLSPPAFIRHGAVVHPSWWDARGGEKWDWIPDD